MNQNSRQATFAMTCDVEDYFQVSAFNDLVARDSWRERECRIPSNVDRILQLLSDENAKATFFTLGWVAENYPNVVKRIVEAGHEVASHGMEHVRVWQQTREEFLEDATRSRKLLQDVSGHDVTGYRAASWSIDERCPWAHQVLSEAGYTYSSSIYPISHDHFGMPDAVLRPHRAADSDVIEIPASVVKLLGRNVPLSGGGYFRLYPSTLNSWLMERFQKKSDVPYIFYFHPWELDSQQPRVPGLPWKSRFKHYLNLDRFEARFSELLEGYKWGRMDHVFADFIRKQAS